MQCEFDSHAGYDMEETMEKRRKKTGDKKKKKMERYFAIKNVCCIYGINEDNN